MRLLLTGILGTYNYGCEAIIRGTSQIMKRLYPKAEIDYLSPLRYDDDCRRLIGSGVNVINYQTFFKNRIILNKVLRRLHIAYRLRKHSLRFLKRYDAVFSIGGDMYTIDGQGQYPKELVEFGNYCEMHEIPYVLWGCSVGPFDKYPELKNIFQKHLSGISLIVAREPATIEYLASMGVKKNVVFSLDPAFSVQSKPHNPSQKKKVLGINLSPLSLMYLNLNEEACIKIHSKLVEKLAGDLGYRIILLPHVVDCAPHDDDHLYLKKIKDALPEVVKANVEIVENDPGFVGIKDYIRKCDVVLAARMHCAINSIASGVPAIFLSYSEKSKGMSRLVYDDPQYCIPLTDFTCEHLDKIQDLINSVRIPQELQDKVNDKASVKEAMDNLCRNKK